MIISMSVSLFLRAEVVQKYENMSTLPSPRSKLPSVRSFVHYASCTINHAKIKIFGDYYIVIPICINYFKNRTPAPPRPRFAPFLWTALHFRHLPSTFWAVFVTGTRLGVTTNKLIDRELREYPAWQGRQDTFLKL